MKNKILLISVYLFALSLRLFPFSYTKISSEPDIFYTKNLKSELTVVKVIIKRGTVHEQRSLSGISFITCRLAAEISSAEQRSRMSFLNAKIRLEVMPDRSVISIECLSEDFSETAHIFFKNLSKPLFSSIRLAAVKRRAVFLRNREEESPENTLYTKALKKLYPDTEGAGLSVYGRESTLKNIKTTHIKEYFRDFFNSKDISLIISSPLEYKKILRSTEPLIKNLRKKENLTEKYFIRSRTIPGSEKIYNRGKPAYVSLSFRGNYKNIREYLSFELCRAALFSGPGSRLWALRERGAQAYSINTSLTEGERVNCFHIYFKTDNKNLESMKSIFSKIIKFFSSEGITREELREIKAVFLTKFSDKITSSEFTLNFAESLLKTHTFPCNSDMIKEAVNAITYEYINKFIKKKFDLSRSCSVIISNDQRKD